MWRADGVSIYSRFSAPLKPSTSAQRCYLDTSTSVSRNTQVTPPSIARWRVSSACTDSAMVRIPRRCCGSRPFHTCRKTMRDKVSLLPSSTTNLVAHCAEPVAPSAARNWLQLRLASERTAEPPGSAGRSSELVPFGSSRAQPRPSRDGGLPSSRVTSGAPPPMSQWQRSGRTRVHTRRKADT